MPPIHNAQKHKFLTGSVAGCLGVAWMAGGGYLVLFAHAAPLFLFAYTVAFALFLGWLIARMNEHFRCPNCGGLVEDIHEGHRSEGDRLIKLCRRCNIRWDIGSI